MSYLDTILSSQDTARFILALLHSLWQGAAVGAALFVLLRMIPGRHAKGRYLCALVAMGLVVVLVAGTWSFLGDGPGASHSQGVDATVQPESVPVPLADGGPVTPAAVPPLVYVDATPRPLPWTFWAGAVWAVGVCFMGVRMVLMVAGVGRLKRQCAPLDDARVGGILDELRGVLGVGRAVAVRVGERLSSPMVIGLVWPTILLPASLIGNVPVEQLRAALAHELAHIRRYDYLVNLIQLVVESLLFFNPALWWISRQIRVEREACCDAIAGGVLSETEYAAALASLAEGLAVESPHAALALKQSHTPSDLVARIRRLVFPNHRPQIRLPLRSLCAGMVLAMLVLGGTWSGAATVVSAAKKLLTPEERIQRVEEIKNSHVEKKANIRESVEYSFTLRTPDGKPLPDDALIHLHVKPKNFHGVTNGVRLDGEGRVKTTFLAGSVLIYGSATGYGLTPLAHFNTSHDSKVKKSFVLKRGWTGYLELADPRGKKISGAEVMAYYSGGGASSHTWKLGVTGKNGRLPILHGAVEVPLILQVRHRGYEYSRLYDMYVKPDETVRWILQEAEPTAGQVVDKKTGKPIPDATIQLVLREGYVPVRLHPDHSFGWISAFGKSGKDGAFALSSLRRGSTYAFLFAAPGYERKLVRGVVAGMRNLQIALGAEIRVRGSIHGLPDDEAPEVYFYQSDLSRGIHGGFWYGRRFGVEAFGLKPNGRVWNFDLRNRLAGRIVVTVNGQRFKRTLSSSVSNWTLNLGAKASKNARLSTRNVIIRFKAPKGHPSPQGRVSVSYRSKGQDSLSPKQKEVLLKDGVARFGVPAPLTDLGCRNETVSGYFFESASVTDVPIGDGPFEMTVPVYPAGVIHGVLLDANGRPAPRGQVSVKMVADPPGFKRKMSSIRSSSVPVLEDGRFEISPLPLGGRFKLKFSSGNCRAVSKVIALSKEAPIQRVAFHLPEGRDLRGVVLGPDGKSRFVQSIWLEFNQADEYRGTLVSKTDGDGRFCFDGLNPDSAIRYTLRIRPNRNCQGYCKEVVPGEKALRIQLKRGCVLKGTLVNTQGQPVVGAQVRVTICTGTSSGKKVYVGASADDKTDAQGRFIFSTLPKGKVHDFNIHGHSPVSPRPWELSLHTVPDATVRIKLTVNN
jgi:beta-lactamase regulating signal transducer with metallopeptidase domain